MPYKHAHWYVLGLFPFVALAFWRAYLGVFTTASVAFHVHGITATLWLLWLAAQSWTIHGQQRHLHRSLGMASLVLFPLFMGGTFLVEHSMAAKFAGGADPFYALWGPELGLLNVTAAAGVAVFYLLGLKNRRTVHVHSRYLLATVIFLLSPIFGRLAAIPLGITGPETFDRFGHAVQIGNAVALGVAVLLWALQRRHGRPWLVAAAIVAAQMLLVETVGKSAAWEAWFSLSASVPPALMFSMGLATGTLAAWTGWSSVPRRTPPVGAVPAE